MSTTPTNRHVKFNVYRPSGAYVAGATCGSSYAQDKCNIEIASLPETGTYTLLSFPESQAITAYNATVWLSDRVDAQLTVDEPFLLDLGRPGRFGRLEFNATAGQILQFGANGIVNSPNAGMEFRIKDPLGACLVEPNCKFFSSATAVQKPLPALSESGTHTVDVSFFNGGKSTTHGSGTITLTEDVAGPAILADGDPVSVNGTLYGQRHRLVFDGVAGEVLGVGVDWASTQPSGNHVYVTVIQPNGTGWKTAECGSSYAMDKCAIELSALPVSGAYTVLVRAASQAVNTYGSRIWLSRRLEVDLDQGPTSVDLRKGQFAVARFSATAGQSVRFLATDIATSPGYQAEFVIVAPSGTCLVNTNCSPVRARPTFDQTLSNLPETGVYEVRITYFNGGSSSTSGSMNLSLEMQP